ncbi:MAG: chemotaxis response regulator protein-glutamate methylesterase [Desulfuromonas sp.]|nr:MAG: chemotaxis response regulator protein-glutamate methylesterase [Desulfuromonas sp.]
MIRILVIDPELSVRVALQNLFDTGSGFIVVGEARTGDEALTLMTRRPDVVLLSMASMDASAEPLITMRTLHLVPVVVMADHLQGDAVELARAAGARQIVRRPVRIGRKATLEDAEAAELLEALRFHARMQSEGEDLHVGERHILAIGASTGGPKAVLRVLSMLPPGLGLSVLIVQHMASALMAGYAEWLDRDSPLSVRLAKGGERLVPGVALVAPGNYHLCMRGGQLRINSEPPVNSCRPSVDVLFESLATECGSAVVAVLLTGIGRDGARGMAALKDAGAYTIAQDEASSVVYGMPRAAAEIGAAHEVLPLEKITPAVLRQFDIAP